MKSDQIKKILDAFVLLALGKSPVTPVEVAVSQTIQSDGHLSKFVAVIRHIRDFFAVYGLQEDGCIRSGFTVATFTALEEEISQKVRRQILENPDRAITFIPGNSQGPARSSNNKVVLIYDRKKNWLWCFGKVIDERINRRMRNILSALMSNNGGLDMDALRTRVQKMEQGRGFPTAGSISDSISDLRKVLPKGISIRNEAGWFTLKMPGEFILINHYD